MSLFCPVFARVWCVRAKSLPIAHGQKFRLCGHLCGHLARPVSSAEVPATKRDRMRHCGGCKCLSVVVPRCLGCDVAILQRQLHYTAAVELADSRTIELLPMCRARWSRRQSGEFAALDFVVWHEHVAARAVEIDADQIAGSQPCQATTRGGLREALRIEGLSDVPDCRPSPIVGKLVIPRFSRASGGCMVTTSADPGQRAGRHRSRSCSCEYRNASGLRDTRAATTGMSTGTSRIACSNVLPRR